MRVLPADSSEPHLMAPPPPAGGQLARGVAHSAVTTEPGRSAVESARKHVLVVTDDPQSGGVAQYNHTILCALAKSGYRVSCLQSRADNPLIAEQRQLGVVHHWIEYHTSKDFQRNVTDPSDGLRVFRADRPDLVIFSDCCPISNFAAREVASRLKIPFITVIGFVGAYLAKNFAGLLPMLAQQYRTARAVVAVSQENLDLLRGHFGLAADAGQVIHYGRPETFFTQRDETTRARLRAELGIPAGAVVCFTAARLNLVKNHAAQIEAAGILATLPGGEKIHFVWAGDGDLRATLEQSIAAAGLASRIHLLGHRWDVADWYDAADIFVLPSDTEGMPLSIMEAMAKGVPVVATAVSGIPEELGATGRLLTPGARDRAALVRELADAIHAWAQDTDKRIVEGRRARTRAVAMFKEDLMVSRTLELIATIIGPGPTSRSAPVLSDSRSHEVHETDPVPAGAEYATLATTCTTGAS